MKIFTSIINITQLFTFYLSISQVQLWESIPGDVSCRISDPRPCPLPCCREILSCFNSTYSHFLSNLVKQYKLWYGPEVFFVERCAITNSVSLILEGFFTDNYCKSSFTAIIDLSLCSFWNICFLKIFLISALFSYLHPKYLEIFKYRYMRISTYISI